MDYLILSPPPPLTVCSSTDPSVFPDAEMMRMKMALEYLMAANDEKVVYVHCDAGVMRGGSKATVIQYV